MTYYELLDWRRRVAELFVDLRRRPPTGETLTWFRHQKDGLFRSHPQSPLPPEQRASFAGLPYWPYDPHVRVAAHLHEDAPEHAAVAQLESDQVALARVGRLDFTLAGRTLSLATYWVAGYAGGLFVPFRDGTSGGDTYGGGRYLLDTIKSADLGQDGAAGTLVLDFNYAYHPSCTYDARWVCPLAPPENRLPVAVRAGERLPRAGAGAGAEK